MDKQERRGRFLTGLSAWALALGCVIGWGSFVMPGSTFLPEAGPAGTCVGVAIAGAIILIIGLNYDYLARKFPENRDSYTHTKKILGDDHAFLSAWSLALAYISLLWANATAFILIGRYLFGDILEWGFCYQVAGYEVYAGEVIVTIGIQTAFGLLACYGRKAFEILRVICAVFLSISILILFCIVISRVGLVKIFTPPFAPYHTPDGISVGEQIVNIAALAPWMFVGFETVCYFNNFNNKNNKKIIYRASLIAIVTGMLIYIALALIAAADSPGDYANWLDYINNLNNLNNLNGVEAMPTLWNIQNALGDIGMTWAGLAVFCALSTSVMGFYHAASSVLREMAADALLPGFLAKEENGVARNAIFVLMIISIPIPFLGRTAVGWNADVSTLSVAIVYAYISICALKTARKYQDKRAGVTGITGLICSIVIFFLLIMPNIFSQNALATESYLMLSAWSMMGLLYYWLILFRDKKNRFGKATVMWMMMLFLLFFSSGVWLRLDTVEELGKYINIKDMKSAAAIVTRQSVAVIALITIALLIMFSLFHMMLKREKELDLQIIQAEERNRAKTSFLSNMSHDIRTPMNAIIGFTNLAIQSPDNQEKVREYLGKIQTSSNHLLALINDVLEMSRIESGKIELDETRVNLPEILRDLHTIVIGQVESKNQELIIETVNIINPSVYCDKLRLNQVLLNLVSNAIKYTPAGGKIIIKLNQTESQREGYGNYILSVKDNGIGMTPQFAERVFEAFEREKSDTVNEIQGTGLGMAITKKIIDLMGGTIEVRTALGVGSEFIVRVEMRLCESADIDNKNNINNNNNNNINNNNNNINNINNISDDKSDDLKIDLQINASACIGKRLLLVDDIEVNREIAGVALEMRGFEIEEARDGAEAVGKVAASEPGYYDAVLMDVQMPIMNGYEAARAIRALENADLARIPIIAMTANAFDEDKKAAFDAGMNGHIAKPINIDQLIETLNMIFTPEEKEEDIGTYVI